MKWAHTVLPFIRLVTSTNKSVPRVPLKSLEIGKNGKQYLTIECVYQHLLKIWYNTIITTIAHMMNAMACIVICIPQCPQISTIWSSSGRLIVDRGRNVLPLRFALVWGMPDVFIVIKAASIACIVLWYSMKNVINITMRECHIEKLHMSR